MIPRQSPSGPHIQLPSAPAEAINRSAGGVCTIDWSKGPFQSLTLPENCTVTLINAPPNETAVMQLEVIQASGGSHAPTFLNTITPGGTPLTLSTANSARDLVRFFWNGTQYLASVVGLAFA